MSKEFFYRQKIKKLSDEKVLILIHTTNNQANTAIFNLAKQEAQNRNLKYTIENTAGPERDDQLRNNQSELKKWNWAAFLLAPVWALANNLDKWAILCFVPGVNIIVLFYLGSNGNVIAFRKSKIKSMADFMIVQKKWSDLGIRLFCAGIVLAFIITLFN
jgi:hypothetical protein